MSLSAGKRPVLSLPHLNQAESSAELFCQRLKAQKIFDVGRRIIPALNQIVHIAPDLVSLDDDVPASCRPLFGVNGHGQPSVFNGFVWSYRADGTHHQVQRFIEGADVYGGRPLQIFHGTVHMHASAGETLVLTYRLGRCVQVQSRCDRLS